MCMDFGKQRSHKPEIIHYRHRVMVSNGFDPSGPPETINLVLRHAFVGDSHFSQGGRAIIAAKTTRKLWMHGDPHPRVRSRTLLNAPQHHAHVQARTCARSRACDLCVVNIYIYIYIYIYVYTYIYIARDRHGASGTHTHAHIHTTPGFPPEAHINQKLRPSPRHGRARNLDAPGVPEVISLRGRGERRGMEGNCRIGNLGRDVQAALARSPRAGVRDDNFNAHSSPPINQRRRIRYTR